MHRCFHLLKIVRWYYKPRFLFAFIGKITTLAMATSVKTNTRLNNKRCLVSVFRLTEAQFPSMAA